MHVSVVFVYTAADSDYWQGWGCVCLQRLKPVGAPPGCCQPSDFPLWRRGGAFRRGVLPLLVVPRVWWRQPVGSPTHAAVQSGGRGVVGLEVAGVVLMRAAVVWGLGWVGGQTVCISSALQGW